MSMEKQESDRSRTCEYCGRVFPTIEALKKHDYESIKLEGRCKKED